MLKANEELPDDASIEDALEVERGLRQVDRGELISQEEACRRMAKWLR